MPTFRKKRKTPWTLDVIDFHVPITVDCTHGLFGGRLARGCVNGLSFPFGIGSRRLRQSDNAVLDIFGIRHKLHTLEYELVDMRAVRVFLARLERPSI